MAEFDRRLKKILSTPGNNYLSILSSHSSLNMGLIDKVCLLLMYKQLFMNLDHCEQPRVGVVVVT